MKRPGITTQLFLAVLATAALVALAMGAAAVWSFKLGFVGYLNEQAIERMEAALPRLRQAYAQHGDWEFVRGHPEVWFNLIGVSPPLGSASAPPDAAHQRQAASDLLGAGRRLTLLDAQRQRVIGFPFILAESEQREIVVDGSTAGWLAIVPIQTVTDAAEVRFFNDQLRASLAMGVVAVLAAALIAWWVARALLAPVRHVAGATHRLAGGDYGTRVTVKGHDEVAQLAQDFNQLALTLERNERVRREFMADISHELRTPLAVLRGEIEAMEDGVHPATPQQLRLLQGEVSMLSKLVGDLHELALADVGALSYRKANLDVAALLQQETELFRARCAGRGLDLQVELEAGRVVLLADEARLRQLLHNLLDNSVRYTDLGGRLQVRLREEAGDAVIDLQDSAPAVASELLPRLFERFYRVEGSRGRAGGGSGLGLAICRSIVQAHGGRIEARPSPLGGVWIEVRLPLVRTESGEG